LSGGDPEAELVRQALAGDVAAFADLCERYRARIWRIAASVAPGPDAEDVAQEALVRAYSALASYHGDAPFEAWLCRIVLNVARDHRRSAWHRRVLLFDRLPTPEATTCGALDGELERRELQRRVRQAVAALPERQRVPIWLHYFEGFSLAEVARLERAPEATIRSRARAGLQRLSLSLDDLLVGAAETPPALAPHRKGCGV
jgi:RNA polymerase sigma-70 factor (ECF subfamily)